MGSTLRRASFRALGILLLLATGACSDEPGRSTPPDTVADTIAAEVSADVSAPDLVADEVTVLATPKESDRLFDDTAPTPHFDLEVQPADWEWLSHNAGLEEYVPATLTYQGQSSTDAAVRYKGAFGSLFSCLDANGELICDKLPLKVSFNEYDKAGRFLGLRKLLFHSCTRDGSCLRERLAYRLFLDAGLRAPRVVHATLSINGSAPSLYALVEYVDKEFLEDHFDEPGGNLYKERWPGILDPQYYVSGLRTNETVADISRVLAFSEALQSATEATFNEAVDPFIDRGAMATYNAVDQLINNWDGIWKLYCSGSLCNNHNYYLYEDPSDDRLVVIPWDLDNTFGQPNADLGRSWSDTSPKACAIEVLQIPGLPGDLGILAPQCDPLLRGLMLQNWEAYRAALDALLTGSNTNLESLLGRLERYRATIRPLLEADPDAPPLADWDAEVVKLRYILIQQYEEAQTLVDE